MAATDSKSSPTSQPVQSKESSTTKSTDDMLVASVKDDDLATTLPVAAAAASEVEAKATAKETATVTTTETMTKESIKPEQDMKIPTYESSESSEYYKSAKEFLSRGDFELSLMKIEEGIEVTKAALETMATDLDNTSLELHESLAPFHYLYGTTLLYSIEESTDTSQAMTTMAVGQDGQPIVGTADSSSDVAADNAVTAVADEEDGTTGSDKNDNIENDNDGGAIGMDNTEDMQIAWENLDIARAIVEVLLTSSTTEERITKLKLDLAQILLREADLQRLNGRYLDAIKDYQSSLDVGQAIMQQENNYNRKIADVEYNLGLSYLASSSELTKQTNDDAENSTGQQGAAVDQRSKLSEEHREKGIYHYLECAKVLCGNIALLCGANPKEIIHGFKKGNGDASNQTKPTKAGLKTAGLDNNDNDNNETKNTHKNSNEATLLVQGMRQRVATLTPKAAGGNVNDTVDDLKQILDEIQETIDEAETAQEAVRQASELNANAQKAAQQGDDGVVSTSKSGITTTIGFGTPSTSVLRAVEAARNSATADGRATRPMMVIKKKKKRPAEDDDSKLLATAAVVDSCREIKRAKTE